MTGERIPDAELEVLACLHRLGEATVRQIREAMREYRPMAHGSFVTLLKRLQRRSLVDREKSSVGKAFVYRPTPRAKGTYGAVLDRLRERVFDGDSVALVASLFETEAPDPEQIEELQELLESLRKKSRRDD